MGLRAGYKHRLHDQLCSAEKHVPELALMNRINNSIIGILVNSHKKANDWYSFESLVVDDE